MKKQIIILFLILFFNCCSGWSQQFVKITTPCSNKFLQNVPGRWIHRGDATYAKIPKQQQQEIFNRLDKIHQWVLTIYPSPLGIDAAWTRFTTNEDFAYQVKVDHLPNGGTNENFVNGIPVVMYSYTAHFCQYNCGRNSYEMMRGEGCEGGADISVSANTLGPIIPRARGGPEEMKIDRREIRKMPVVKGTWKGYPLYTPETGSDATMVILHREGILPYVPVTRKQYLDLSIIAISNMYDEMIVNIDKTSKAFIDAGMADAQTIKKNRENFQKQKKDAIKHYQDELATTTAAGLLDKPAIIDGGMGDPLTQQIFSTEEKGGTMLVTENAAYFRKDIPKYVPQFMIFKFGKGSWFSFTPNPDPMIAAEENFPIEKLQAMIDK
jgi:hypothetical protein